MNPRLSRLACAALAASVALMCLLLMASYSSRTRHAQRNAASMPDATPEQLRASARRLMQASPNLPDYSKNPPTNMGTRSCFEEMFTAARALWEEKTGQCVYGVWCGSECRHDNYDDPANDDLDEGCKTHDMCLYPSPGGPAPDTCHQCACDQALVDHANQVWINERKCDPDSLWDCFFCWGEHDKAEWALAIKIGMELHMGNSGCSDIDYSNCPEPKYGGGATSTDPNAGKSSSCPFDWYQGYDLVGGDLADGTVAVSVASECCDTCNSHPDCYAWVFSPDNAACEGPCCFLKDSSWTGSVEAEGMEAGTFQESK